jgi:Kef-type K+ transport system membrane component KefB/nucleotide-binding universal stress UspA family protein
MAGRGDRRTFSRALGVAIPFVTLTSLALAETTTGGSSAGGHEAAGTGEVILLAQIVLLLLIGRGLGELMQRFGQPAVIGQLLAGLILGPSLFGWVWPAAHDLIFPRNADQKNLLTGLSDIGVLLLLLLTGMETDLKLVRRVGPPAIAITITGVAVPFACGFALGQFLPETILSDPSHRLIASLFLGTALSISSIKIVAMVVREMNFMRRNLGQIIVASAIMEDTVGWVIISLTLGIAGAGGLNLGSLATSVIGTVAFLIISYTAGRRLVFWLIRMVNDTFVSEYAVVTAILIVMCVMALITQAIGVNTVLGAFVAGILVGESPILSQHIEDQLRGFITAFMMPIFFGMSGLSADLTVLKDPQLAFLTFALVVIASAGKFTGAFSGGLLSGLSRRESLAVGCGMNARGSTEVIVATIGLGMGALTQNLYTMIVTMAVLTTMAMPPMLRWALGRLPLDAKERARLEKEELDESGFVSQFDRLLTAVDESPNGKFASRLAGFIAGQRGKPITVLHVADVGTRGEEETDAAKKELAKLAKDSAKKGSRAAKDEMGDERPDKTAVSTRGEEEKPHIAVAEEAEKGYDFLFVGIENTLTPQGIFSADVERLIAGFNGPFALIFAGADEPSPKEKHLKILVPVNGTEASRRGAEIAMALSSAKESTITALHVDERSVKGGAGPEQARVGRKTKRALLEDMTALAKRYGYRDIEKILRPKAKPDTAILEVADSSGANLIVMGASRRVGDTLYLGQTVEGILRRWKHGLVLVVS